MPNRRRAGRARPPIQARRPGPGKCSFPNASEIGGRRGSPSPPSSGGPSFLPTCHLRSPPSGLDLPSPCSPLTKHPARCLCGCRTERGWWKGWAPQNQFLPFHLQVTPPGRQFEKVNCTTAHPSPATPLIRQHPVSDSPLFRHGIVTVTRYSFQFNEIGRTDIPI